MPRTLAGILLTFLLVGGAAAWATSALGRAVPGAGLLASRGQLPREASDAERSAAREAGEGSEAEAAGLEFTATERRLGRLDVTQSTRVVFPWRATGTRPLRILRVQTGCGCVLASGLPDVVTTPSQGELVLEVAARAQPGPFRILVQVLTDRPPFDVHRLLVQGFVGSAVLVEPAGLHLGAVSTGRVLDRAIVVRPPPHHADLTVHARLEGLEGHCEVGPPALRSAEGADVRVRCRVPASPGPFLGFVEIHVAGEGLWRIPAHGVAVASEASPQASAEPEPVPGAGPEASSPPASRAAGVREAEVAR